MLKCLEMNISKNETSGGGSGIQPQPDIVSLRSGISYAGWKPQYDLADKYIQ